MAESVYVYLFPQLCFICVHMQISGLSSLVLGLGGKECSLACTAHMLMKSDSLLCRRQRRSYLFV